MINIVYHPSIVQHMVKQQMTENNISVGCKKMYQATDMVVNVISFIARGWPF